MSDSASPQKSSQQLLADALKEIRRLRADVSALRRQRHMPIAVIGMSCRFPGGATTPDAFWQLLKQGSSGIGEIDDGRWDMDDLYDADPLAPGKLYSRHAGLLQDIEKFDAELFGISPMELQSMDPQHRVFLEAAWSCIEHAGIAPAQLAGLAVGVYVGIGTQDFSQLSSRFCSQQGISPYNGTGVSFSAIGGRLAYLLDLRGPAVPVDTACSSSLVALHLAVQGLRRGECDAALVGGVMLMLNPATSILFCKAQMLSPDGRCKTFDASADGYVRGEGCGVVMLKRLDDALRDNDNILALIRGSAVNQDGRTQGLTAPNEAAQVDVIRRALRDAEVTPADVTLIEAHGTGTSLGDPIEMAALATAYCHQRATDNPLFVGSLKTNVGHMEAAAGVGALEKVILALQHAQVPPHINFTTPSPYIDWAALTQVQIPRRLQPWPPSGGDTPTRLAGISSFGFTGTNVHVIVEQAPALPPMTATAQPQLFKLSAQRPRALRDAIVQQAQFIADSLATALTPEQAATLFARLCYTANRGRNDFRFRVALVANDAHDLQQQLQQLAYALQDVDDEDELAARLAQAASHFGKVSSRAPATAWMFAGEGSEYAGMAQGLYRQLPLFHRHLDECAAAFAACHATPDITLTHLLWGEHGALLAQAQYTLPALFAVEYALARTLLDAGLQAAAVVGHSAGEYAAACIAGVFSLQDAMKLVCARGQLMHTQGAPAATQGAFADIAASITYRAPRLRFYSSVSGVAETTRLTSAEYWVTQVDACVKFDAALRALLQTQPAQLLEIGPDRTLCDLARRIAGDAGPQLLATQSARHGEREFWQTVAALYGAGATPAWELLYRDNALRPLPMPGYVFQRETFWHPEMPQPRQHHNDSAALHTLLYRREWSGKVLLPSLEPIAARGWLLLGSGAVVDAASLALQQQQQRASARVLPAAPTRDACAQLLQQWLATESAPAGIVVTVPAVLAAEPDAGVVQQVLTATALSLLQALAQLPSPQTLPLWFVVNHADAGDAATTLARGIWGGIVNVIALELPQFLGGYVEFDAIDGELLVQQLLQGDGEDHLRYRAGQRSVARLRKLPRDDAALAPLQLNHAASYVVTGGLGSLGLGVAQHLVARGAKSIVLLSRSGEANADARQQRALQALRAQGVLVECPALDVGDRGALHALFDSLEQQQRPLRGIVHAAGAFDLTGINDLDMARCASIMDGKVLGAWHLHELTRERALDFFVLFSSIASVWGSAGNFHYAAANHVLDIIAAQRREAGLPVCNINWGPWAQSTMAQHNEQEAARRGLIPLQPAQGMAAFDLLLRRALVRGSDDGDCVVADVAWPTLLPLLQLRGRRPVFDGFASATAHGGSGNYQKQFVLDRLHALDATQRLACITDYLASQIAQAAGIDRERFDNDAPLLGFGLDSLMALDLRNRLKTEFAVDLPVSLLLEGASTGELAQHLLLAVTPALQCAAQATPVAAAAARAARPELEMLEGEL